LRVIIDVDSEAFKAGGDEADYLLGLLHHESILAWRYSDHGPPADAKLADNEWINGVEGWIKVGEDGTFTYATDESVAQSAIHLDAVNRIVSEDREDRSYEHLDAEAAAQQRRSDMKLIQIGKAADIDVIITDRAYLHGDPFHWVSQGQTELLTAHEALPVVGLYLRLQHQYIVAATPEGRFKYNFNKGLMSRVASRALLPEGWRWMSACVQRSTHLGEDTLTHYAGTAHHRLERALNARDELFLALNQPQNNDTAADAMMALDTLLLSLSAALDVTARVMNYVLDTGVEPHLVGWGRKSWRKRVAKLSVAVGHLIDDQTFADLVTIVGSLRNTIHGAALDPLALSEGISRNRTDTLVGLPSEQLDELLEAMDRLGGHEQWGVRKMIPGRAHADVDVLCERLMATVPATINRIMRITPVESLAGVTLPIGETGPDEDAQSPFASRYRVNILLQYGLEEPSC